jgi:Ni,Fe-hydrogenase I cytochrome b subunit
MALIVMFVMFVIAAFSGLTGRGLYVEGAEHSMFALLQRIVRLFMIPLRFTHNFYASGMLIFPPYIVLTVLSGGMVGNLRQPVELFIAS